MIISASYKTDIPTFYGEWFINRLRAGYCKMVNPYNKQPIHVPLGRRDVDGFVFWTKNIGPFVRYLPEIAAGGYPFIIQQTINRYPRFLETSVVNADACVTHLHSLRQQYGPKVCVWRYDTVVVTSQTPLEFHVANFTDLCRQISGATDEVVISFAHFYDKTLRNMNAAAKDCGFEWRDPSIDEKRELVAHFVEIASEFAIIVSVCSQRDYLVPGAVDAKCIDIVRMSEVAGESIHAELKGNRQECGCFQSRDIGEYDTCPHGCVYCYAVRNRPTALRRYHEHDPQCEFLFSPSTSSLVRSESQGTLFKDE